ncbi:MAG: aminotransferase class V-fold PLP-dependent enzyme, partial [Bacteroidota bacterium]
NIPEGKIMFNDQDYPSLRYPFEHGRFSTVVTHSMTPWKQDLEALENEIIEHQPKYFAFSHVHYNTGVKTDLQSISAICKRHNVKTLVDGTQGIIVNQVNLEDLGIDAYLASTYKWCWGGYGAGVIAISRSLFEQLEHNTSNNNNVILKDRSLEYEPGIASLEPGHFDHEPFFRLEKALRLIDQYGLDKIVKDVASLFAIAMDFATANNIEFIGQNVGKLNNIFCLPYNDGLAQALKARNIQCSVRGESIRFSIHAYNNQEDLFKLCDAIKSTLPE